MGMATTTLSYLTVQPDGIPDAPIVHPSMDDAFTKVPVGETSFNQSVVQSCADMSVAEQLTYFNDVHPANIDA